MVTITSDPVSPVQPVGTNVTLTCNVELDRSVDVPLTVDTVWNGPDNFNWNIMAQQMGNTTTYTSTVKVSSFGRNQSGDYTCTATVSSMSSFIISPSPQSATSRITVGELSVMMCWNYSNNIVILHLLYNIMHIHALVYSTTTHTFLTVK